MSKREYRIAEGFDTFNWEMLWALVGAGAFWTIIGLLIYIAVS